MKIGIIDTGTIKHPDLNVVERFNYTEDTENLTSHGTHVAGIIGAKDNNQWITGQCPNAEIVDLRWLNNKEKALVKLSVPIMRAIKSNCKFINMSVQTTNYSENEEALKLAYDKNIIMFASAMNQGQRKLEFPANSKYVISVGATDSEGNIADFSNYGTQVDYYTQGVNIESLSRFYQNNHNLILSGTSQASPRLLGKTASDCIVMTQEGVRQWLDSISEIRYDERGFDYKFIDIKDKEWQLMNSRTIDTAPVIINNRTMIPARGMLESLGATVDWNEDTQEVSVMLGNKKSVCTIGSKEIKEYEV